MKEFYAYLLSKGWTMNEIDDMDIFYYFDVLIYEAITSEQQKIAYIDDVM